MMNDVKIIDNVTTLTSRIDNGNTLGGADSVAIMVDNSSAFQRSTTNLLTLDSKTAMLYVVDRQAATVYRAKISYSKSTPSQ